MRRTLIAEPATEPVTLSEFKAHLRLAGDDEDVTADALLVAARGAVEAETRRALVAQGWRIFVGDWPAKGLILPVAPIVSVDGVRGVRADRMAVTLPAGAATVEPVSGRLVLMLRPVDAVAYEIDVTAGYGASGADVPAALRQAILLLATHWFENRAAAALGDAALPLPLGYRELVAPYRRLGLC